MARPEIKTIQNLESAFAGESMAHIKYRYFAKLARAAGDQETAKIFEATADQEVMHAFGHLDLLYPASTITPTRALEMKRADAKRREMASSAAETMLEVGALTTMTPAAVAAGISTLSSPTPARAITFKPFAAAIASASILVAERINTASTPAPSAARSSSRLAPSQLRTSKSGPSACSVAGLSSSAINTTGLATSSYALLVIILIVALDP